ncbi:alpha/beta hydrolase [Blastomonas sp.]|uniref:alpha/beta hydrolase family protein n=1 Tax=Blastomonas sp. TaxID=1909299 RepID=UPI00260F480A|nr:alpha/beta hydrolase [Blastomonas sp.]MDM7956553.1 alpha/beta hydrolase [Blastomonas sp.]
MRTIKWGAIALAMVLLAFRLVDAPGASAHMSGPVNNPPIMQWPDLLEQPRPAADQTFAYGDDPLQLVDLWLPQGAGPHPVVVMIHGGCWQTEIATRDIMNYIADDLRKHGIAVWNIEYRGVDRGGGHPGTYHDVGAAADLLAAKAQALNLDLSTTIAIGHSAGGHLALWLAARQALPADEPLRGANPLRIDAAISQAGIADLRAAMQRDGHACGTEAPKAMAGDAFALTSPPEMPVSQALQIQFHTDKDRIAPPAYATEYAAVMAKRGITVETHVHGPEGHVELIAPASRSWAAQRARIQELLSKP